MSVPRLRSTPLTVLIFGPGLLMPALLAQEPSGSPEQQLLWLADPRAMEFYENAVSVVSLPIGEVIRRIPHLRGVKAAKRQDELAEILDRTSLSVQSFFQDFPNVASDEQISQEYLAPNGIYRPGHRGKFGYLALNRKSRSATWLDEFRVDSQGHPVEPQGFFVTQGFVSAAAIFHPTHRNESMFSLLGLQEVKGHETFVVAFAQIPNKARLFGKAEFGRGKFVLTLVQGVAWIDGANFQIIRLYRDLLAPRPDVGLKKQSTELTYEEVHFKSGEKVLWLPNRVEVTESLKGETYRSVHTYSNFHLFTAKSRILPAP